MLKRYFVLIIASMVLFCSSWAFAAVKPSAPMTQTLTVNGKRINAWVYIQPSALAQSDVAMFPLRAICEALADEGISCTEEIIDESGRYLIETVEPSEPIAVEPAHYKAATVITPKTDYTLKQDSNVFAYDNNSKTAELEAYVTHRNGMIYAPETFFTEIFSMTYTKDSFGNHVLSSSAEPETLVIPGASYAIATLSGNEINPRTYSSKDGDFSFDRSTGVFGDITPESDVPPGNYMLTVKAYSGIGVLFGTLAERVILVGEMPDDFRFSLSYGIGGLKGIDTYENTLTKNLIEAGQITVDFTIPQEKLKEFYRLFMEYDIRTLPNDINAAIPAIGDGGPTPMNFYTLTYTLDGESKTIKFKDNRPVYQDNSIDEIMSRYLAFVNSIITYIDSTDEYKNLPPSIGGYR